MHQIILSTKKTEKKKKRSLAGSKKQRKLQFDLNFTKQKQSTFIK